MGDSGQEENMLCGYKHSIRHLSLHAALGSPLQASFPPSPHQHTLSLQEENYGNIFMALDQIFLSLYVMEILLKWYHDFLGFWKVGWNVFDFVIVAASLLGPSECVDASFVLCTYIYTYIIIIYYWVIVSKGRYLACSISGIFCLRIVL